MAKLPVNLHRQKQCNGQFKWPNYGSNYTAKSLFNSEFRNYNKSLLISTRARQQLQKIISGVTLPSEVSEPPFLIQTINLEEALLHRQSMIDWLNKCSRIYTGDCWTSCFLCRWRACLERSSCRRHFSTFSVHFPKTFKTTSLFTHVSWPSLLN